VLSIAVRVPFDTTTQNRITLSRLTVWVAAIAVIVAGLVRYAQQPSFWLDEAFVAVTLQRPSPHTIFAQLEYGQFFPRIYLAAIAALREVFGYTIWALRLLPFLSFIVATLLWARLLAKRSQSSALLNLLAAVLLVGASFWLDQAIQLKQYTFDVLLALVPFLIGDDRLTESLAGGKRRLLLIILALPCLLSYTYPMALGARTLGWYLHRGRREGWRVDIKSVSIFSLAVVFALAGIWATDLRFNFKDIPSYQAYWSTCILRSAFEQSMASGFQLLAKFLSAWHGRQPLVTAGIVPLQIIGVCRVISVWKNRDESGDDSSWGSLSFGSLILLIGVIAASAFLNYPICAGRVVLFTQIHTQIFALEGVLFILTFWSKRKALPILLYIFAGVVMFHSVREYVKFVRSEPAENLRPMITMIDPVITSVVWVHSCSIAQVRSLPAALPVERVLFGPEHRPRPGEKTWVIWTHLGDEFCRKELDQMRERARSWQLVHEGSGRGLALAEF
jgi:uncharacterized membrane protein HdeD (DUF308 family)